METWTKHDFEAFPEAPTVVAAELSKLPTPDQIPIQTISDLGIPVPPRLKTLVELGDDPNNRRDSKHPKYESRSEVSFAVMTWLSRLGVPADKIAGVCINREYGISERFLERADPAKQAFKEALRAKIAVSNDWPDVYKNGSPQPTFPNAYYGLIRMGIQGSYDQFKNRLFIGSLPVQDYIGELSDKAVVILRKLFLDSHSFDARAQNIRDGVETLALENTIHPLKEYFETLEWDKKPRIRGFFSEYMGAENTDLNQAIAFIMFVAAVRRILQPGCKFDTMIVLEGKQGSGKSTALRILATDEFFSDQDIISADSKTQMELLEGVWIYEVCELSGLKHTDIGKIKSFLSRQEDRGRPAYGRYKEVIKRQSIFVGTTNDEAYLKDRTGNRRFLPVKTSEIDLEAVKHDRDQLWAEALYWEAKDASIVLPEELWVIAAREQEARMYRDPWLDLVADIKGTRIGDEDRIFTKKVLEKLEIPASQQQHYQATRLGDCMRKLGWQGPKRIRIGRESLMGYYRPAASEECDNAPGY